MAESNAGTGTVIGSFLERASEREAQPLWYHQSGGRWLPTSWASARSEVLRLAAGLASIGIAHGERVGLMGPNVPQWVMADFAIQHVGGVVVPIYSSSPPDQIEHILNRTGVRVCIAYGDELLGRSEKPPSPACTPLSPSIGVRKNTARFSDTAPSANEGKPGWRKTPEV